MTVRPALFCLALAACSSGVPVDGTGRARAAIVGGQPAPADVDVYRLAIDADGAGTTCSATLIAPHTLLTAAHCVDPVSLGARVVTVRATNAPSGDGPFVDVAQTRLHPLWMPAIDLGHDLALLRLAAPQPAPPRPLNLTALTGLGGAPIRAVGYGTDLTDGGMGTRRSVELVIRQLSDTLIDLGDLSSRGVCHGDSGGPTFHRFGDDVERLIGVHSFTRSEACVDGADTRVDREADFLLSWIAEHEDACAPNGVCATGPCPASDPDCRAPGAACETAFQCPGRDCGADAQHPRPYCSRPCGGPADCPTPLTCEPTRGRCQLPQLPTVRPGEPCRPGESFCLDDGVCSGVSAASPVCSLRCVMSATCPASHECGRGFTGDEVCLPRPRTLPFASVTAPAAPRGCSTGEGLALFAALGLALRRRAEGAARSQRNC